MSFDKYATGAVSNYWSTDFAEFIILSVENFFFHTS